MRHYFGTVAISPTMNFENAVDELNRVLAPFELCETDRFDEVPGYWASTGQLEFELQGTPEDLAEEDRTPKQHFYFSVRFTSNEVSLLPKLLDNLPSVPVQPNGYSSISAFLRRRLQECTSLECEVAS